jgi:hypothetical protein
MPPPEKQRIWHSVLLIQRRSSESARLLAWSDAAVELTQPVCPPEIDYFAG